MNFEDEPYVRLYTTDTASWSLLGWEGQTVLMHMLRGRFDRAGVFDCGRHEPSRAVTGVTRLPPEIVERGLAALLNEGTWVVNGNLLVWPNFVHAQTCARSDRLRQAESRKNRRNSALAVIEVESQNVTDCHDESQWSRSVTLSSSSPSLAEPSRAEQESAPEARNASARPDEQATWDGSERETLCPLDLGTRAAALKIPEQLAESLKVDLESVQESIREFVGYWTIGAGMGQKRRHWMRKLREHVRKAAGRPGGLAAPGALEHQQRTGRRQEVNPNLDHETRKALAASKRYQELVAGAK
jgi:hypothetical protein